MALLDDSTPISPWVEGVHFTMVQSYITLCLCVNVSGTNTITEE